MDWYFITGIILIIIFVIFLIIYLFTNSLWLLILGFVFLIAGVIVLSIHYYNMNNPTTTQPTPKPQPTDNIVRYGDTLQLQNISNLGYADPCFSYVCDFISTTAVTIRPDASYNQAGGASNNLRKWIIMSGTNISTGTPVNSGDTIQLISISTLTPQHKLALCTTSTIAGCGHSAIVSSQTDTNQTVNWILQKDIGTQLSYGDSFILRNTSGAVQENRNYLGICTSQFNQNPCGLRIHSNPLGNNTSWKFVKI